MNLTELTVQELKARIDSNESFHLIDVREEWEFQEFNIGAQNIPLTTLMNRIDDLEEHKEKEVIIHCKMGGRSMQACMILQQHGFKNIKNVTGGLQAWIDAYGTQPAK